MIGGKSKEILRRKVQNLAADGETKDRVRLSVDVTPEVNAMLEALMPQLGATNKGEVLRKAIALIKVATDAKAEGHKLYIGDAPPPGASREIVGI